LPEGPAVSDVYPDETVRGSRASMVTPVAAPAGNVTPVSDAQVADAAIKADPKAAAAAVKKGGIPGLEAYVQQYRDLIGAVPEDEVVKAEKERLKNIGGELDKRKKEDLWGALTQFGLNLASSQSPYFLQAVGQAGAQTMPAITGATKERRAAEAEARKAQLDLARMARAEELKAIEGGIKLHGEEQTRGAQLDAARTAANKPTDMRAYAADVLAAASGDKDAAMRVAAVDRYLELYGSSAARAGAAQLQASTAQQQAQTNIQDRARDNVDKALAGNWNSPENDRIRQLRKADRKANNASGAEPGDANYQDSVTPYKNSLYSSEEVRLRGGSASSAPGTPPATPRPGAAPQAVPKGQFSVKAPNGMTYYFPTKEAADTFAKAVGSR
jgi:hypothetical protein